MPKQTAKGRNVKSAAEADRDGAADRHERVKDFPSEGEVARLLYAAKDGRVSTANFA